MWDNADELVVGGSGEVFVAPIGTALPVDPVAALDTAFVGLGYTDDNGVAMTINPDFTEFGAWQSKQPVRREFTKQAVTLKFALEQWNEINVPLAFGGGKVTSLGGGKYRYDLPSGTDSVDERAMVVDIVDGSEHWRLVWPRGNVTESAAVDFARAKLALLPLTFGVLAPENDPDGPPGYFLTDSAALAPGS